MNTDGESRAALVRLRQRVARIERTGTVARTTGRVALGHDSIDARLGGGLMRGRLHEVFAAERDDSGSAIGFAAMLAHRLLPGGATLLWLREDRAERAARLHAPGLVELGFDPARLVLAVVDDAKMLLAAAADGVRCTGVGGVVIELWRTPPVLDLTASRRLAVAAEASGVTPVMLRIDAEPMPSAADTRWRVAAAASRALPADAPGYPAFDIELIRQRGGIAGLRWQVEWDRDTQVFRDAGAAPPLSRAVVPLAERGPVAAVA